MCNFCFSSLDFLTTDSRAAGWFPDFGFPCWLICFLLLRSSPSWGILFYFSFCRCAGCILLTWHNSRHIWKEGAPTETRPPYWPEDKSVGVLSSLLKGPAQCRQGHSWGSVSGWYKKIRASKPQRASQWAAFLHGFCFSSWPEFLPCVSTVMDFQVLKWNKLFPPQIALGQ